MKILVLLPSLSLVDAGDVVAHLVKQTMKIQWDIHVISENLKGYGSVGEKMSFLMNKELETVNLADYDYLLRVDSDVRFPLDLFERTLKNPADLVGVEGGLLLLKTTTFLKAMGGKFARFSDDTYTVCKFKMLGYNCKNWSKPRYWHTKRHMEKRPLQYYLRRGVEMWREGYEPVHVLFSVVSQRQLSNLISLVFYLSSAVQRKSKYDVARWRWNYQTRRLLRRIL